MSKLAASGGSPTKNAALFPSVYARLAACTCVCACALALATPAGAFVGQFGEVGEGPGQFSQPAGIAINQGSGDAYVADEANGRIERWTNDGTFVSAWGWGVEDASSQALQVCTSSCFAGLEGDGAGEFRAPRGLAVDNSPGLSHGDVYVIDSLNRRVEKFSGTGEFLLMFGGAVNANTHADICDAGEECQAGAASNEPGAFESLGSTDIAVDATGHVFVASGNRIQEFSPAGTWENEITLAEVEEIAALAVDPTGNFYVASAGASGVKKYSNTGVQLGEARGSTGGLAARIATGQGGELFVMDLETHHVAEYDSEGSQLASLRDAGSGGDGAVAVDEEANTLYLLHGDAVHVVALPTAGPYLVEGSTIATEIEPLSAVLRSEINPEGGAGTEVHFEYGTTTAYGAESASTTLSGGQFEDQQANLTVEALLPDTEYHFRVVAKNEANQTIVGPDETFRTLPAISVDGESVTSVSATSATLIAELNPHNRATTYRFEFGTTEAYGTVAPEPDGSAGEGSSDRTVTITLQHLTSGTVYHYRVVAHNSFGTVAGADRTFVTSTPEIPAVLDGRGYEQVSPIQKHDVSLESPPQEGGVIQAAADGAAITYIAKGPIVGDPSGNRSVADSQYLSTREATSGWATRDISTPHESITGLTVGQLAEYREFSTDLHRAFVEPFGATPLTQEGAVEEATERTPYRREANGSYVPLVYSGDVQEGVKWGGVETTGLFSGGVQFQGATPDGEHAIVGSPAALTPGVSEGTPSLFEWSQGLLTLVSVLPNGVPAANEGIATGLGDHARDVRHALSDDGNRVFFSAGPHLFMRDVSLGETIQLDLPAPKARGGSGEAHFQLAASDGSRVFFSDVARLTVGSTATSGAEDVYYCDLAVVAGHLKCDLHDITVTPHPAEPAGLQGAVIGADEDANVVYFVTNGALTNGSVQGSCEEGTSVPTPTASCNLYSYEVETESLQLVAVVSNLDSPDWSAGAQGQRNLELGALTARVSPSGRYLAFMSARSLTGFDNRDSRSGAPDEEVFLYDRSQNSVTCVSCAASGERPEGIFDDGVFPGLLVDRPAAWKGRWLAASLPAWSHIDLVTSHYQPRYLLDSGRLFFNSKVGLVPSDGNHVEDVYEYEPNETGGCQQATGCVGLMTGGSSSEESAFLDASTSGDALFVMSAAKLAPSDKDGAFDVYDVRVCSTASPCVSPAPVSAEECNSLDACRPAPAPQPAHGAPPTLSVTGSGNVPPQPKPPTHSTPSRAKKLAAALRKCRRLHGHRRRVCVMRAHKRYGASKPSIRTSKNGAKK
jgi:hypothetical protein